jgi:RNA polymerase sigma-70 factor (ECF subfamily)
VTAVSPPTNPNGPAERHLDGALRGDPAARTALVRALLPVAHVRVYRTLQTHGATARGRCLRQEIEDLTQDAMVALFEEDGRVLRGWDPTRGLSFLSYVGLVVERMVAYRLRSKRLSPWTADPTDLGALIAAVGVDAGHERRIASRETLDRVWRALKDELSPRGRDIFHRLIVEGQTAEAVGARFGLRADAIYAWRSRFLKRARLVLAEVEGPPSSPLEGS